MNMDNVYNTLGLDAQESDKGGERTRLILSALDGMLISQAKHLLTRIASSLEEYNLDYSPSDIKAAALEGIRHAEDKDAFLSKEREQETRPTSL